MSLNYLDGCDAIPDYVNDCCVTKEAGRVRHVAFVHTSFAFANNDLSDETEWQRGISEGNIAIVKNVRGQLPEATWNEEDGFGDIDTSIGSATFEPSYIDQNVAANCGFYNGIKKSANWKPVLVTESYVWPFDKPATVMPKQVIPEDNKAYSQYSVSMRITQDDLPCPQPRPDGIFDCDPQ
jgi:hypothetical protein